MACLYPTATLNRRSPALCYASRKDKVWRLARHNHQERTNVHSYTNSLTLCSFPLGKARMGLSPGNSVGVALSRRRYRSRNISGTAANNTIINNKQGDTKYTKSRGDSCRLRLGVPVGDACRKTSFPPHRPHHPHRHARHGDSSRDGKKSGPWPFKKSAVGGTKTTACRRPSQLSEGTEKVPFFYDQNGKCLRFVTSLSANRLNKAKIDRK